MVSLDHFFLFEDHLSTVQKAQKEVVFCCFFVIYKIRQSQVFIRADSPFDNHIWHNHPETQQPLAPSYVHNDLEANT